MSPVWDTSVHDTGFGANAKELASMDAIAGSIMGCLNGKPAILTKWLEQLKLKELIETLGMDPYVQYRGDDQWAHKYPGW